MEKLFGFFKIMGFFSGKYAFLKISADFFTGYDKLFFQLKALRTRIQTDVNICYYIHGE